MVEVKRHYSNGDHIQGFVILIFLFYFFFAFLFLEMYAFGDLYSLNCIEIFCCMFLASVIDYYYIIGT